MTSLASADATKYCYTLKQVLDEVFVDEDSDFDPDNDIAGFIIKFIKRPAREPNPSARGCGNSRQLTGFSADIFIQ